MNRITVTRCKYQCHKDNEDRDDKAACILDKSLMEKAGLIFSRHSENLHSSVVLNWFRLVPYKGFCKQIFFVYIYTINLIDPKPA